jgi:hypothetical protein
VRWDQERPLAQTHMLERETAKKEQQRTSISNVDEGKWKFVI